MPNLNNRFDIKSFLDKIAQIESSGGKNFAHREIASGIQAGDRGIGRYGLMPNTVREIAHREAMAGKIDPDIIAAAQLPSDQMKQQLETNPEIEQKLAESLGHHLQSKFPGDEERMAYGWTMGHNIPTGNINDEDLNNSNYVNKFRRVSELMKNKQDIENIKEKPLQSSMGDIRLVDKDLKE